MHFNLFITNYTISSLFYQLDSSGLAWARQATRQQAACLGVSGAGWPCGQSALVLLHTASVAG